MGRGRKKQEYSFLDLAEEILQDSNTPLSANAIWELALEKGITVKTNSSNPGITLNSSIYQDIQKNSTKFYIASRQPVHWGLLSKKEEYPLNEGLLAEGKGKTITKKGTTHSDDEESHTERDLHPLLARFARAEPSFGVCYTKTVYHEESIKKQNNDQHWLHPDIVGVSYPFYSQAGSKYGMETLELMKQMEHNECKLFSFEMKKHLDYGNRFQFN